MAVSELLKSNYRTQLSFCASRGRYMKSETLLLNRKVDAVRRRPGGGHAPASARLRASALENIYYLLTFAVFITAVDSIPITERFSHRHALVGRRTGHRFDAESN
jgi:hypothetical protein